MRKFLGACSLGSRVYICSWCCGTVNLNLKHPFCLSFFPLLFPTCCGEKSIQEMNCVGNRPINTRAYDLVTCSVPELGLRQCMKRLLWRAKLQTKIRLSESKWILAVVWQATICCMEELKWSGTGGWIVLRRVKGVHCVHYIGENDCTARFATGAIWEIPD